MIRALAMQMNYYRKRNEILAQEKPLPPQGIDHNAAQVWIKIREGDYGEESLELLSTYGIKIIPSNTAATPDEAVEIAGNLGYPVVMKVVSPQALHKTDAGGVLLDIKTAEEITAGFDQIRSNLKHYNEQAVFSGVRIQKMAPGGYDMFVGGKYDPSFGPVIYFGMGGIYIEVIEDITNILCPASYDSTKKRLKQLKAWQILSGLRGNSPGDVDAFIDLIIRTSYLLTDFPGIKEIDINPVRVFAESKGALALDARIRLLV